MRLLPLLILAACGPQESADTGPDPAPPLVPELLGARQVVPGVGLSAEVVPQPANNNLDIAWHNDRLFLAFRTAPTHFA
ncbi:MAG: hypothetical protein GWP91_08165, partial [Rhodobacterales bacterium]|nr:hypothetical protein [Rhodobacterales bacterium]